MTATVIRLMRTDANPRKPVIAVVVPAALVIDNASVPDPDLWLYRERTVGMLRRYLRISIEVGRLPSLLGREFFRTRVTSYRVSTFEDAVIFVHDVERSLDRLDAFERKLIGRIVLQEYTQEEAVRLLQCGRRTVGRRFPEVLDRLSEDFLAGGLLTRLPETNSSKKNSCQEPQRREISASHVSPARFAMLNLDTNRIAESRFAASLRNDNVHAGSSASSGRAFCFPSRFRSNET
jgi:hypothetical protein